MAETLIHKMLEIMDFYEIIGVEVSPMKKNDRHFIILHGFLIILPGLFGIIALALSQLAFGQGLSVNAIPTPSPSPANSIIPGFTPR